MIDVLGSPGPFPVHCFRRSLEAFQTPISVRSRGAIFRFVDAELRMSRGPASQLDLGL